MLLLLAAACCCCSLLVLAVGRSLLLAAAVPCWSFWPSCWFHVCTARCRSLRFTSFFVVVGFLLFVHRDALSMAHVLYALSALLSFALIVIHVCCNYFVIVIMSSLTTIRYVLSACIDSCFVGLLLVLLFSSLLWSLSLRSQLVEVQIHLCRRSQHKISILIII